MATIIDGAFRLLTQLALAKDGGVLGVALACGYIYSCHRHNFFSSALKKISNAESVSISDLPALVAEPSSNDGKLVVVRGLVQTKSSIEANWHSSKPDVLVCYPSGAKGVVLLKSQTCIYNDRGGIFGWMRAPKSVSLSMVPIVLVDNESFSEYVTVDMDGSTQPLPLTTVYHHLEPIPASPYTFLQALLFRSYPIGLLEEDKDKLLPLGKEISAVGTCISHNGNPQIKSCKDLPYFLSVLTKDQMLVDLSHRTNVLFWAGIVLGTVSAGILGYALTKSWQRWKSWIEERRTQQLLNDPADSGSNEEHQGIPERQLCAICRMRRKICVFEPCGHLVCCPTCSLSVFFIVDPKCPICRRTVRSSLEIADY